MRVLVTGGAGFIGSHLVDQLLARGDWVTVLDDFSTGSLNNLVHAQTTGRMDLVVGSILDPRIIDKAIQNCDAVYHLAVRCVRRSLGNPRDSHDINATGTLNMLEAARRRGIARFVYCSSSEVYGNTSSALLHEYTTPCRPVTVYGAAKLSGELYSEAYWQTYALPVVVARPFNAYGPRAHEIGDLAEVVPRFVIRVLNGLPPVIFGDGNNGRDFTFVTEVARGLLLAGTCDRLVGRRVNLAYGQMITVGEVAKATMRACGRNDLGVSLSKPRPGDVTVLAADTRSAKDTLGYCPEIAFDEGIRHYIEWFRKRHPDPSQLLEPTIENWTMPTRVTA
jgi:UDP-glucose 4-epimerase